MRVRLGGEARGVHVSVREAVPDVRVGRERDALGEGLATQVVVRVRLCVADRVRLGLTMPDCVRLWESVAKRLPLWLGVPLGVGGVGDGLAVRWRVGKRVGEPLCEAEADPDGVPNKVPVPVPVYVGDRDSGDGV